MTCPSGFKKSIPLPEEKQEYVQRWLAVNFSRDIDNEEKTSSDLSEFSEKCKETLKSPIKNSKLSSTTCTSQVSPILGGKRLASSQRIGSHKSTLKRIKLIDKIKTSSETKETESTVSISEVTTSKQTQEKCDTEDAKALPKLDDKFNNCFSSSELSIEFNDNDENVPKPLEHHPTSQLIESTSSKNESREHSEMVVQEIFSNSEKTESDLIEDISTQLVVPLSQNISNPSSNSPEERDRLDSRKTSDTRIIENLQQSMGNSTGVIETTSTLESRINFSKIPYILSFNEDKQKKIKIKKDSLLETLVKAMAKEKSKVTILRHQVENNKSPIVADKSYVLFQVVQYLPTINGNQFFKCILIEDNTGLLNDLLKNKTNCLLTVMNVPEISSLVNVKEKPILKVYKPLVILDPNQLLLQITRFVALPPSDVENLNFMDKSMQSQELKVVQKCYCPCLDEKVLSLKCNSKYTGSSNKGMKILFDC